MRVAVCSETEDAGGLVPADFKTSPFLLMIDVEKNQIYHVYGKQDPENRVFAEKTVDQGCEAIICGPLEKEPFEIMANAGISRFDGSGHKAQRAYIRFLRNQLPLIRDYIGGPGPVGHSHDPEQSCSMNREDTLFELTPEEAENLPDEMEIPDGLSREEIEEWLARHAR